MGPVRRNGWRASEFWAQRGFEVFGFGADLPEVSSARFQALIEANAGVFSVSGEPNGECGVTTMSITTTGRPISQKAYRTPLHKRRLVEDCVQMLADGVIRPSCSPWASPITLVPKASGGDALLRWLLPHQCRHVTWPISNSAHWRHLWPGGRMCGLLYTRPARRLP